MIPQIANSTPDKKAPHATSIVRATRRMKPKSKFIAPDIAAARPTGTRPTKNQSGVHISRFWKDIFFGPGGSKGGGPGEEDGGVYGIFALYHRAACPHHRFFR